MPPATWLRTVALALALMVSTVVPASAQEQTLLGTALQAMRGRVVSVDSAQGLLVMRVAGEPIVVRPPAGQPLPPVGVRVEVEGEAPLDGVFTADALRVLTPAQP